MQGDLGVERYLDASHGSNRQAFYVAIAHGLPVLCGCRALSLCYRVEAHEGQAAIQRAPRWIELGHDLHSVISYFEICTP